ncbi:homocysteine S-methyltransferase [Nocardioides panzhihuensis]|uniref:Homocysteine S-methyltransferase n=1 Tax=Nocardioides panzhihuensis TaxID=860243 RepID=A0A7Z0DJM4_9ACTN|nr:homocysteine S-methyltransferase [Nocardioides panzhihuensis]
MTILDGGLSNALEARGHDVSGALWTARLLDESPEEIAAVHRAYFSAGADVATTASYQASVPGFVEAGMTQTYATELLRRSVRVAREVAEEAPGRLVAASIGPYGAYLADGSEYRGRYGVTAATLRDFHAPRLALLETEDPDLIAVETIPDTEEAEVLVDLLDDIGLPVWFSYSCAGTRTRAGQPLADALALAAGIRSVVAVGVNCCDPADVPAAVQLAAATGKPAVVYPNSGETYRARSSGELARPLAPSEGVTARSAETYDDGAWSGDPHFRPGEALSWVRSGAGYVGGCCRVGPAEIALIAAEMSHLQAEASGTSAE